MAVVGVVQEVLFLTLYHNLVTLSNNEQLTESLCHSCYGRESRERRGVINYGATVDSSQTLSSVHSDPDFGSPSSHTPTVNQPNEHDYQEPVVHVCQHFGLQRTRSASQIQDSNEIIENAEHFMCSACDCTEKVDNSSLHSASAELSDQASSLDATGSSFLTSEAPTVSTRETSSTYQRKSVTLSWSHHLEPLKNGEH